MEAQVIHAILPTPDPAFVASLSSVDLPAHLIPSFQLYLPRLYELFLRKREAFQKGDTETWDKILEEEQMLVAQAMHDV